MGIYKLDGTTYSIFTVRQTDFRSPYCSYTTYMCTCILYYQNRNTFFVFLLFVAFLFFRSDTQDETFAAQQG